MNVLPSLPDFDFKYFTAAYLLILILSLVKHL